MTISDTILSLGMAINPLTPMPAITGRNDPWPFFHFWRHHFWPKLASSELNFCGRRRSFQWCPDQSDRPNGAWDMHINAQKVERKSQTKICCHYTRLLHGENCATRWRFPRSFLTASKPSRRSIIAWILAVSSSCEVSGERRLKALGNNAVRWRQYQKTW